MTCMASLQRWKLLIFFILLTSSAPSNVECSYSVRDDEGCQETSFNTCSRPPACTVNHSSRGGVTHRCSDLGAPGRLPRPAAWMLVALLSALAGATACWLANLLAPPPGCRRKTNTERPSRSHRLPAESSQSQQRRELQERTDMRDEHQHATT